MRIYVSIVTGLLSAILAAVALWFGTQMELQDIIAIVALIYVGATVVFYGLSERLLK